MNEQTTEMILNISANYLVDVGIKLGTYPSGTELANYYIVNGVVKHTIDSLKTIMEYLDAGVTLVLKPSELSTEKVMYPLIKQQKTNEKFVVAFTGVCEGMYIGGKNPAWDFGSKSKCWVHHDCDQWENYHRDS